MWRLLSHAYTLTHKHTGRTTNWLFHWVRYEGVAYIDESVDEMASSINEHTGETRGGDELHKRAPSSLPLLHGAAFRVGCTVCYVAAIFAMERRASSSLCLLIVINSSGGEWSRNND